MRLAFLSIFATTLALAQAAPDRILGGLQDRALADQAARLRTDDRISLYNGLVQAKPENLHYQVLLAGAYIQKMRETTDFSYVDRAAKLLEAVISSESGNYEALRLRTEVELERHNFKRAAEYSKQLTQLGPQDSWNWGTLGDAYIELGDYDQAADAYQKMIKLRPDLSSYNRAAHYRFLTNDMSGAIEIMRRAIDSGSASPENTAWCWVELGAYYFKTNRLSEAESAYANALRTFPNYHPAYAGLGKTRSAQGKTEAAIQSYVRAQAIVPLPDYAAALYDLYSQAGRKDEAAKQMDLIDAIDALAKANGEKTNRNLALIYADHDRKLDRALELATAELGFRQDVYTYDALAWALYKNGRYEDAAQAMDKALRLNTPEPMFQMHAAKIRALERMFDSQLTVSKRNDACFELRGKNEANVREAMLRGLKLEQLRACAAINLRFISAEPELKLALRDENPEIRALAARELGSLRKNALLPEIAKAAADPNLLVSTNAVEGLSRYTDPEVLPYLDALAAKGGIVGILALDRLAALKDPARLAIARQLLQSAEVPDRVAGMRVIGEDGDPSDLSALRKIAATKPEVMIRQRGFGLMPTIDLSRAATATIAQIEARGRP